MTVSLEKIFFAYILRNKKFFEVIEPFFFKNTEIQFVFNVLRKYLKKNTDADIPHPKQIFEMVQLEDLEGLITREILKSILSVSLQQYDESNFIIPKFNAWILSNKLKIGTVDIIDETRNLDTLSDFEGVLESANKIKVIVENMSKTDFVNDDEDLGSDFDDPEQHLQDQSKFKVKTGFPSLDHILGGGWDVQTLNILMGMSNAGKCCHHQTNISIRNILTGNVQKINLFDLFTIFQYSKQA